MKVTNDMIDKELRFRGQIMKFMLRKTSKKHFERMNKLMRSQKGAHIKGFKCEEIFIPSREGHKIRVRIYRPLNSKKSLPGILYTHGGGYVLGSPEGEHMYIQKFLEKRDCVIVAPDYRLAVDAPYPAAIHDCYDTLLWMKNSTHLNIKKDQLFLIGASAGGGLAASLAIMARDYKEVNIAFQMPLYPMLDHRMITASMKDNDAPLWTEEKNKLAWSLYLDGIKEVPIYASPALNDDFSNLPPASSFIGTVDGFLDETRSYFKNLMHAGIRSHLKEFKGGYHGFEGLNPKAKISKDAITFMLESFDYACEHYFAPQTD